LLIKTILTAALSKDGAQAFQLAQSGSRLDEKPPKATLEI